MDPFFYRPGPDPEHYEYLSEPGVCPECHGRNFYIHTDGTAECVVCGMHGQLKIENGKTSFTFPEENLKFAHTTLPGKMKHVEDSSKLEVELAEALRSEKFQARKKAYREFIQPSRP